MAVPYNLRLAPFAPGVAPISDEDDATEIILDTEGDEGSPTIADGAISIENADGSVVVQFGSPRRESAQTQHDANLVEDIDNGELNRIASDLLDGIAADEESRREWLETRAAGISLLGLKLEQPGGTDTQSSAPMEGMSTVRHPLLLEAVLRFQANARGELLPSAGPVKVRNDGEESTQKDVLAEALEKDLNHYLTVRAKEYYPDTSRMLFYLGFGGCAFKKVYRCPIRNRPVSESVDAKDIVVSNAVSDMSNAGRLTHVIDMRPATLKRMQIVGAYRDVEITSAPQPQMNPVDQKIAEVQGVQDQQRRPEDQDYTIYECYCELNIAGFEHKDKSGEPTGLPVPYCVVIEKDSRQVLAIRRNWEEGDELCLPKIPFVKYSFVPGLGFYDIGLVHILGNSTNALTAAWRMMLDAGMFANFPGFLFLDSAVKRQTTNEFRVPPGGGMGIQANGVPSIRDAIMPLPYKDPGAGLKSIIDDIAQTSQRVGGTAEVMVGEGRQDAPVGTTLAMIEQATKIVDAVHKNLHAAQAEEFGLLRDLFRDDPAPLWRGHRKSALARQMPELAQDADGAKAKIVAALDDNDLVPAADPNTPSHMHRVMRALAIKQLQAANPALYDAKKVDERVLAMIHVDNPADLFAPDQAPAPPSPSPDKVIEAQARAATTQMDNATKLQIEGIRAEDSAKDRESKEKLAVLELAKTLAVHPEGEGIVRDTLGEKIG